MVKSVLRSFTCLTLILMSGRAVCAAPELLFHASFDGTAVAETARGGGVPIRAEGLEFAPGRIGQAVRTRVGRKSWLEYAFKGNVIPDKGAVAAWIKREWPADTVAANRWEMIFATHVPEPSLGSGAMMFWHQGDHLRLDVRDVAGRQVMRAVGPAVGQWEHVVFCWDGTEDRIVLNGRIANSRLGGGRPLAECLNDPVASGESGFGRRLEFKSFFVGGRDGIRQFDGLIDDLRVYSEPLSEAEAKALFEEHATEAERGGSFPDYEKLFAGQGPNRYVGGDDLELELLETVTLDAAGVDSLRAADRFTDCGASRVGSLAGIPYHERLGLGSRFAVRFRFDSSAPIYCFDIDYPDDRKRTMDVIVQNSMQTAWDGDMGADYTMQVGVMTGDPFPISEKMLTHRCLYWPRSGDATLEVMTARADDPAAVARIRFYRVLNGRLPPLKVRDPKPVDGWRRQMFMWFEDPAIGYDFGVKLDGSVAEGLSELIDRTAAVMKYTGETVLAAPGAWYCGLIGDSENPRFHAYDYRKAWYVKFDREGLGYMPTLNVNNMPWRKGVSPNRETMANGSLHDSPYAIHASGKTNWGGWHGTPPNFNIFHPATRRYLEDIVDVLVEEGREHPSFRGVGLHLARHCLLSWGNGESGYNDYCIEAFEQATGIKVPCDRKDPLRGKAYHEWLRANAWDRWIDWRCHVFAEIWGGIARKMAAVRSDLKLCLCTFGWSPTDDPRFTREDSTAIFTRESGVDVELLQTAAPNIIVMQTVPPAAHRIRTPESYPDERRAACVQREKEFCFAGKTWDVLANAAFPMAGQHDFYWETGIGLTGDYNRAGDWHHGLLAKDPKTVLDCPWLRECRWRVTTINPPDRQALAHFVVPLRYHDVFGTSKGGFLIGTYGMEGPLREFAAALRALPAVKMKDVPGKNATSGLVRLRACEFDGRTYFYVVNTGNCPTVADVCLPPDTEDLVSGRRWEKGGCEKMALKAYEMRSFSAPRGCPTW